MARTFEELAFMFTYSNPGEFGSGGPFEAGAQVSFNGPFAGLLVIRLFGSLRVTLTRNMLGEAETPEEEAQNDSLKELANVVCGNLLPLLGGEAEVFNLQPPELTVMPSVFKPPQGFRLAATATIGLDGGQAEGLLFLQNGD